MSEIIFLFVPIFLISYITVTISLRMNYLEKITKENALVIILAGTAGMFIGTLFTASILGFALKESLIMFACGLIGAILGHLT